MILPSYSGPQPNLWEAQLILDVLVVVVKDLASEALHVLDDDRLWPQPSDNPHDFWEKIPFVLVPAVFTAQRPRLTRYAACNQLKVLLKRGEVEFGYVGRAD